MFKDNVKKLMDLGLTEKAARKAELMGLDVEKGRDSDLIYITATTKAYDGMTLEEANKELENWY